MKLLLALCISIILVTAGVIILQDNTTKTEIIRTKLVNTSPSRISSSNKKDTMSLFVPYWSLGEENEDFGDYDAFYYFGITPTRSGIDTQDAGYLHLEQFTESVRSDRETHLVLRMLESKLNFAVLEKPEYQKQIINETVSLAKKYGFDGIILDLELAALPFDSLIKQINTFSSDFSKAAKKENLSYGLTMYGDVYYRVRPYDVKTLAEPADSVLIMAYDLHKAGGNPGPNFPLRGKDTYGYDYSLLTERILRDVPPDKIIVIFGLYGYDWQVDEKNISQRIGKALSYLQIQQQVLDSCEMLSCKQSRDKLSGESVVSYSATDGAKHTVWYEDTESVRLKQEYLRKQGITNFSYWAHSYF